MGQGVLAQAVDLPRLAPAAAQPVDGGGQRIEAQVHAFACQPGDLRHHLARLHFQFAQP